jgi:hypothetical protein
VSDFLYGHFDLHKAVTFCQYLSGPIFLGSHTWVLSSPGGPEKSLLLDHAARIECRWVRMKWANSFGSPAIRTSSTFFVIHFTAKRDSEPEQSVDMPMLPIVGSTPNNSTRFYIPVGSLSKSQTSESYYPAEDLAFLEKHHWIRTNHHNNSGNIQILVLPQDVQRASIHSPSDKVRSKLKSKLKGIMARIDNSDEAWHGSSDARSTNPAMGLDCAEDESLWYIFNTLQNPGPLSHDMQDPHAKQAMEALLGESDPVQGLKTKLYPYQQRSAATMVQREAQPAMVLDSRLQSLCGPNGSEFYYDKMDGTLLKEKRLYSEACGG